LNLEKKKCDELIAYWREGSKEDLASAIEIFKNSKKNGPALFYLHLALKKVLKSYFVEKFQNHAPYTHNLIILIEK
jgi:HEPN domain-containing protein